MFRGQVRAPKLIGRKRNLGWELHEGKTEMWKREKVWSWQQSRREVEAQTKRNRSLESVTSS